MPDNAGDEFWRDADGVVHAVVAVGQLPEPVEEAIVGYLVVSDGDEALRRLDELRDLLDSWHEAALEEAAQSLAIPQGDACQTVDIDTAPRTIDRDMISALEPLLGEPAIGRRLNLLDEALRLVDDWLSYHLDPEKLVGHLVLSHGVAWPLASLDHDLLLREHEDLHR